MNHLCQPHLISKPITRKDRVLGRSYAPTPEVEVIQPASISQDLICPSDAALSIFLPSRPNLCFKPLMKIRDGGSIRIATSFGQFSWYHAGVDYNFHSKADVYGKQTDDAGQPGIPDMDERANTRPGIYFQ